MKSMFLNPAVVAIFLGIPIALADDGKPGDTKEANTSSSASTSVTASGDGTVTVTIESNGKKETRTVKVGEGGAKMGGGGGGFGGDFHRNPGDARKEKGPWIGIAMEPVPEVLRAHLSLARGEGIVVSHVAPESPAARAGLAENDILVRFEDQILVEPSQLRKLIGMKKPGDSVKLAYLRKGERKETSATLVEHEIEPAVHDRMPWFPAPHGPPGEGWEGRMQRLQEQMKQWKDRRPGIIVDKRSWLSDSGPGMREQFKGFLDGMRKQLENSGLPKEEQAKIRRNVEEAVERARRTIEDAVDDVKRWRKDEERKHDGPPKKPSEPL